MQGQPISREPFVITAAQGCSLCSDIIHSRKASRREHKGWVQRPGLRETLTTMAACQRDGPPRRPSGAWLWLGLQSHRIHGYVPTALHELEETAPSPMSQDAYLLVCMPLLEQQAPGMRATENL